MEIKRDRYLKRIISFMWDGQVKVITGIRRCGKSYLLRNLFKSYLLGEGVAEDHILSFELDLDRRRNNLKIELRYMLAQLLLTVLSFYFHLGLAGFLLSIAILLFYLRVINPRYMGRKLWWKKPKRAVCKMKKGSRDGS